MTDAESEWGCTDSIVGITLSVSESIALWEYFQRADSSPYWDTPEIASVADKAKSFHKYGPWDNQEGDS